MSVMEAVSVGHVAILCFAGLLCWALVSDALTMQIPNRASLAIALLYPAWLMASWPSMADPWLTVAIASGLALAVLLVGFVAFNFGLLGAGDAKLLAATTLWAGPAYFLELIAVTTVIGGVVALAVAKTAVVRRREALAQGDTVAPLFTFIGRSKMPYGIAIGVGGMFVAAGLWT